MAEEFDETLLESVPIDKHKFYFETALYKDISADHNQRTELFRGEVVGYNPIDKFDTTYEISLEYIRTSNTDYTKPRFRTLSLVCKRNPETFLIFYILIWGDTITKVGQYPSLADIQFAELGKKYDKFLSETDLKNYKKAVGLYSHGTGAGSFVYLRRIFENLIFESWNENKAEIVSANFQMEKMIDKIKLLEKYLPSQLTRLTPLYGILSKGIHELEEEECLEYFKPLKLAIDLILEEKISTRLKLENDKKAEIELKKIENKINTK